MALSSDELRQIGDIVREVVKAENEPILQQLDDIEVRLGRIEQRLKDLEKWSPVQNSNFNPLIPIVKERVGI